MAKSKLGTAYWAKQLEEWAHSGLSVPAFCQQRGLSDGTMKVWLDELEFKKPSGPYDVADESPE